MKLSDLVILNEASFSAKNFPEDGNKDFAGAGERTNYIESEANKKDGFPLTKDIKVVKKNGERVELKANTKVFITEPGKLFRGEDIGASPKTGIFTLVSKKSSKKSDALGYAPISSIQKPSGKTQQRTQTGSASQDAIADEIKKMLGDNAVVEVVSTAAKGSTAPDVILNVNDQKVQFEVKGTSSSTAPITFFDKSMRRGTKNEFLDEFGKIVTGGKAKSFTDAVDFYRKDDPTIGFPGDEGTGKSGKLPSEFRVTDSSLLKKFHKELLDHFAEGGDNYFAVHNRAQDKVDIYHTGHGPNPLKAPKLPPLKQFDVKTYGGPSGGAMRVGLKIKLQK